MVSYEPLIVQGTGDVIAYTQGMLYERTRYEATFLAKMGIRYVLDHGHRALESLTIGTESHIGIWHLVERSGCTVLLWQPNEGDLRVAP